MADPDVLQPTNDNNEALDFGKKKKKKKVKEDLLKETETEPTSSTSAAAVAIVVPETEKNKSAADSTEVAGATAAAGENEDDDINFNLKKKKKAKPQVKFDVEQNEVIEFQDPAQDPSAKLNEQILLTESDGTGGWAGTERDYTYDELLNRVFNIMREKNPDMVTGEKRKFVMKPPQVNRVGTKKTSFSNFADICKLLRRQEKHLLNFLLVELGTSGSLDINKQLTIKGKFQQKQIENVLRRYIKEYVTCHTCRSPDTTMVKEERLFFLKCENCAATCSVASIKLGFQAQVGKRAAQRARAT
jgi:translation initiation factor 2 subunit 2